MRRIGATTNLLLVTLGVFAVLIISRHPVKLFEPRKILSQWQMERVWLLWDNA